MGGYHSQVAFGQSRVLLDWTRLIMPNGRSIVLERQPGKDAAGYSEHSRLFEPIGTAALIPHMLAGAVENGRCEYEVVNAEPVGPGKPLALIRKAQAEQASR
ncbi:hypothetical protein Bdiaspc4_08105 [Bradyrhizobium diazoefficiens]|nr:hypothetical protein [Bradyrhizobium japonicum]PDT55693.1 hypothetical protein CO678_42495 [Bradyrhizobium diazoefficiens]QBP20522.1 hypothetical protein Bdiaspc4_08105 [Bradyrhizobium diazoefficiens]QIO98211.1 hypothetical protein HAU57_36430 [Bradyrhizobium diazoefficiens]